MKTLLANNRYSLLKTFFLVLVFSTILIYGYFKLEDITRGPVITVSSPQPGATYDKKLIMVRGEAKRIAKLYLNDRQIFTDQAGNFREPLLLLAGYNILTLNAEDQFGRQTVEKIELTHINN